MEHLLASILKPVPECFVLFSLYFQLTMPFLISHFEWYLRIVVCDTCSKDKSPLLNVVVSWLTKVIDFISSIFSLVFLGIQKEKREKKLVILLQVVFQHWKLCCV